MLGKRLQTTGRCPDGTCCAPIDDGGTPQPGCPIPKCITAIFQGVASFDGCGFCKDCPEVNDVEYQLRHDENSGGIDPVLWDTTYCGEHHHLAHCGYTSIKLEATENEDETWNVTVTINGQSGYGLIYFAVVEGCPDTWNEIEIPFVFASGAGVDEFFMCDGEGSTVTISAILPVETECTDEENACDEDFGPPVSPCNHCSPDYPDPDSFLAIIPDIFTPTGHNCISHFPNPSTPCADSVCDQPIGAFLLQRTTTPPHFSGECTYRYVFPGSRPLICGYDYINLRVISATQLALNITFGSTGCGVGSHASLITYPADDCGNGLDCSRTHKFTNWANIPGTQPCLAANLGQVQIIPLWA